jgi:RNA polymerase sigma factor (sigma-70 family)
MFAVCYQYSKSREEAEDTFHEGFMKVFQNIQSFSHTGSFEGWIRKIMVNTAIGKYRKNSHLSLIVNIEDHKDCLNEYYSDDILDKIEADELLSLVQQLPPAYKMVFNLFVFEGMQHKEIAEQLGISPGSSKSNLYEARTILKKLININYNLVQSTEIQYGRK